MYVIAVEEEVGFCLGGERLQGGGYGCAIVAAIATKTLSAEQVERVVAELTEFGTMARRKKADARWSGPYGRDAGYNEAPASDAEVGEILSPIYEARELTRGPGAAVRVYSKAVAAALRRMGWETRLVKSRKTGETLSEDERSLRSSMSRAYWDATR